MVDKKLVAISEYFLTKCFLSFGSRLLGILFYTLDNNKRIWSIASQCDAGYPKRGKLHYLVKIDQDRPWRKRSMGAHHLRCSTKTNHSRERSQGDCSGR